MKVVLFVLSLICVAGSEMDLIEIIGNVWLVFAINRTIDLLFLVFWAVVVNRGWFNEF